MVKLTELNETLQRFVTEQKGMFAINDEGTIYNPETLFPYLLEEIRDEYEDWEDEGRLKHEED